MSKGASVGFFFSFKISSQKRKYFPLSFILRSHAPPHFVFVCMYKVICFQMDGTLFLSLYVGVCGFTYP